MSCLSNILHEIFRETDTVYHCVPKLSALVSNVIAKNLILLADDICNNKNNNNSNKRMKTNAGCSSSSLNYNHTFRDDHCDTHIQKLKLDYGIFDMDPVSIQCIDKAIQQAIRFQADSTNLIIEACICGDLNQVKNCCEPATQATITVNVLLIPASSLLLVACNHGLFTEIHTYHAPYNHSRTRSFSYPFGF